MSKRQAQTALVQPAKRLKLDGDSAGGRSSVPEVTSSRQLQQLLLFQQDSAGQLRTGELLLYQSCGS